MVAVVLTPERTAIWAHVGDSRLYRFDGPNCAQRTTDHSYVEKLVQEGKLNQEEAKEHRLSHVLVNILGDTTSELFVTIDRYDALKPGDSFCS